MQGTIMKITESQVVVLSEDGRFVNLPKTNAFHALGERIEFSPPMREKKRKKRFFSSLSGLAAAVLLFSIIGLQQFMNPVVQSPVALIALDINPSLEFELDSEQKVVKVHSLNSDAVELMDQLDTNGERFDSAYQKVLTKAKRMGYLERSQGTVMLTLVALQTDGITLKSLQVPTIGGVNLQLYQSTVGMKKQADESGLSLNKFIVYKQALQKGIKLDIQRLKSKPVAVVLGERGIRLDELLTNSLPALEHSEARPSMNQDEEKGATDANKPAAKVEVNRLPDKQTGVKERKKVTPKGSASSKEPASTVAEKHQEAVDDNPSSNTSTETESKPSASANQVGTEQTNEPSTGKNTDMGNNTETDAKLNSGSGTNESSDSSTDVNSKDSSEESSTGTTNEKTTQEQEKIGQNKGK